MEYFIAASIIALFALLATLVAAAFKAVQESETRVRALSPIRVESDPTDRSRRGTV